MGTVIFAFQARIIRQSGIKLPLQASFRFRMAWISGFGLVFFQLPPLFESG